MSAGAAGGGSRGMHAEYDRDALRTIGVRLRRRYGGRLNAFISDPEGVGR